MASSQCTSVLKLCNDKTRTSFRVGDLHPGLISYHPSPRHFRAEWTQAVWWSHTEWKPLWAGARGEGNQWRPLPQYWYCPGGWGWWGCPSLRPAWRTGTGTGGRECGCLLLSSPSGCQLEVHKESYRHMYMNIVHSISISGKLKSLFLLKRLLWCTKYVKL